MHEAAFLNNSRIPLMTHQTWRTLETQTWNDVIRQSIEQWIKVAVGDSNMDGPETAWFLWDDDGIDALIKEFAIDLYDDIQELPYPVEKADVFRVLVLKWFGGTYADVDARPLKHPFSWIQASDLTPWTDPSSGTEMTLREQSPLDYAPPSICASYRALFDCAELFSPSRPLVSAIFGIEADNPPDPDSTYWRMGYTHSVQITNWALSMAPHHAVADQFLSTLVSHIRRERGNLLVVDPLDITGPPALTAAIQAVARQVDPKLSWDALSARNGDPVGGRGKVVAGDALILPITGFNPGRGWFQNMGSMGVSHPNARVEHTAAGSWRKIDLFVHSGKICRATLGLCKDWKKIPL